MSQQPESKLWEEFLVQVPSHLPGVSIPLCGLCGNTGYLRQCGVRSPAGVLLPALDRPCICPNGRCLKEHGQIGAVFVPIETEEADAEEAPARYHNYYHCDDCDESWSDAECDSAHNDRCPGCRHEITPYKSIVFVDGKEPETTHWRDTGTAEPGA